MKRSYKIILQGKEKKLFVNIIKSHIFICVTFITIYDVKYISAFYNTFTLNLHEKDHKNCFLTFCIFLLSYFYISLRLDLWSGSDCEEEKKKVPQEKNCVPARRALGLWCFESHHPSRWLFVAVEVYAK